MSLSFINLEEIKNISLNFLQPLVFKHLTSAFVIKCSLVVTSGSLVSGFSDTGPNAGDL